MILNAYFELTTSRETFHNFHRFSANCVNDKSLITFYSIALKHHIILKVIKCSNEQYPETASESKNSGSMVNQY